MIAEVPRKLGHPKSPRGGSHTPKTQRNTPTQNATTRSSHICSRRQAVRNSHGAVREPPSHCAGARGQCVSLDWCVTLGCVEHGDTGHTYFWAPFTVFIRIEGSHRERSTHCEKGFLPQGGLPPNTPTQHSCRERLAASCSRFECHLSRPTPAAARPPRGYCLAALPCSPYSKELSPTSIHS